MMVQSRIPENFSTDLTEVLVCGLNAHDLAPDASTGVVCSGLSCNVEPVLGDVHLKHMCLVTDSVRLRCQDLETENKDLREQLNIVQGNYENLRFVNESLCMEVELLSELPIGFLMSRNAC